MLSSHWPSKNPIELRTGARFEQVRPGGYDPTEHLRDNATDGVVGAVLYPTEGLLLYTQADTALLSASCRAYNDFLAEFCASAPDRLKGVAMLNTDDIDDAVAEMHRARSLGLSGALIPTAAPSERLYDSPEYEPLWQAALGPDVKLLRIETAVARRAVDLWMPAPGDQRTLDIETSGDPLALCSWIEQVLGWQGMSVHAWQPENRNGQQALTV